IVSASYGANIERPVRYFHHRRAEYQAGRSALQRDLMGSTADLWGGGERVPELDRYPLLLICSLSYLFLYPAARCLPASVVSAVICTVRSLWSSLCCPQSLVIP
ncbi:unnamed protein product, partial [Staurois parvus]